jgi:hypothetical protein
MPADRQRTLLLSVALLTAYQERVEVQEAAKHHDALHLVGHVQQEVVSAANQAWVQESHGGIEGNHLTVIPALVVTRVHDIAGLKELLQVPGRGRPHKSGEGSLRLNHWQRPLTAIRTKTC